MALQVSGQVQKGVFPNVASGTSSQPLTQGQFGEALVSELNGRYANLALASQIFTVSNPAAGVLSAAGNISPIAAAGTPILTLYNPTGSGKNLVILVATAAVFSATASPLAVVLNVADTQTITAATNLTPINASTLKASGSTALAFSLVALTGSTVMRMYRALTAAAGAADATAGMNQPGKDELAGELIIPPGGVVAVATGAAGTAAQVLASFTWAELPI